MKLQIHLIQEKISRVQISANIEFGFVPDFTCRIVLKAHQVDLQFRGNIWAILIALATFVDAPIHANF